MAVYLSANCEFDPEILERFLVGQVTEEQQSLLEDHVECCRFCRARLEEFSAQPEMWDAATRWLDIRQAPTVISESLTLAASSTRVDTDEWNFSEGSCFDMDFLNSYLDPAPNAGSIGLLGKYEIHEVIGRGGMGIVLKAFDPDLGRLVAIKMLRPHLHSSVPSRIRFAREAKSAGGLRHENIIPIYSVEQWRDSPFIVMPLVEQGTLQQFARHRKLHLDEILSITLQIAQGLAAAHEQAMVHRDIKPSNILLMKGIEHVAIADFGLARAADDEGLTHSGIIVGTPMFMSPEQARGEAIDTASDMFSLGSLVYWLCVGKAPFVAESSYGTLLRIIHNEPIPICTMCPDLPSWVERLVDNLLKKTPQERTPSATLVTQLSQCVQHQANPKEFQLPEELLPIAVALPAGGDRRRWRFAIATFIVFIGSILLLVVAIYTRLAGDRAIRDNHSMPQFESSSISSAGPSSVDLARSGPLDGLEQEAMLVDLKNNRNERYWLRRFASLPVGEIPGTAMPYVIKMSEDPDAIIRELANIALNKNPFEYTDPPNPFATVETKP